MQKYKNVAIIIPALNEVLTVAKIVKEARSYGCDVYVVDDNSEDETADEARSAGAEVLILPFRSGAWNAAQAGMLYAIKKGRYDFFITMDADGQHEPDHIPLLMDSCSSSNANVVIGSCVQRGSIARRITWSAFFFLTRLNIHDMTSGFKLYDKKAVEILLSKEAAMFDYQDLGPLLLLRRKRIKCIEVPISMCSRENGCSRIFNSWISVSIYLIKTCVWVFADWISKSGYSSGKWTDYDSI
ncbi:glycosyltransferase family 2 protein [Maridesulfovibrio frigidus]|uniref:glycosyltransferase family 2 protein n=1 Tax=Maridesulfovibrio frigidus TaxID=340956 RepID=UPI0004E2728C|nr:glycosyltransferase family 2 protein [Maridesulfovibrio frigidus]